jgi:hypothetical protein
MTTLVCWKSVDSSKKETLNFAADSRFSDGAGNVWDGGRKLFYSRCFPDIFVFCGEVLPVIAVLSQILEAVDSNSLGKRCNDPVKRMENYKSYLDRAIGCYERKKQLIIVFATREFVCGSNQFFIWKIVFKSGVGNGISHQIKSGSDKSHLIGTYGTGKENFKKIYDKISKNSPVMSRYIYWSFIDHIKSNDDKWTGGPPQMIRLGFAGPAKPVGILYKKRCYLLGFEILKKDLDKSKIADWHNEKYEFVNPVSGSRKKNAQRIERP